MYEETTDSVFLDTEEDRSHDFDWRKACLLYTSQYQYTKDIVTDSKGDLKGVSWQACPGLLVYRRDIAKAVFGTDDPDEIQKYVADWDTFKESAKVLADAGYDITSSAVDTYRVFSNNVTSKWVEDGKLHIDENIMNWVTLSKEMVDAGQTGTSDLWSDDWSKGFYPEGNVFCYFGPAWFIDFSMSADTKMCIRDRAYGEINEMEKHLTNAGAILLKFWLHIDKDEQERRFKERMADPAKQWKMCIRDRVWLVSAPLPP